MRCNEAVVEALLSSSEKLGSSALVERGRVRLVGVSWSFVGMVDKELCVWEG